MLSSDKSAEAEFSRWFWRHPSSRYWISVSGSYLRLGYDCCTPVSRPRFRFLDERPRGRGWKTGEVDVRNTFSCRSHLFCFCLRVTQLLTWRRTNQKTRDGCGCFWCLFRGSRGKLRESFRKSLDIFSPNREMLQILGFRAPGKAHLPRTFGRHCLDLVPTFRAGCFLKSTVPAFSSFSEIRSY